MTPAARRKATFYVGRHRSAKVPDEGLRYPYVGKHRREVTL